MLLFHRSKHTGVYAMDLFTPYLLSACYFPTVSVCVRVCACACVCVCVCVCARVRADVHTVLVCRRLDFGPWTNHSVSRSLNHTLWIQGVKIDCGERFTAKSLFYDLITYSIYTCSSHQVLIIIVTGFCMIEFSTCLSLVAYRVSCSGNVVFPGLNIAERGKSYNMQIISWH